MEIFFLIKESIKDTIKQIQFSYFPFPMKTESDEIHLQKTIQWLEHAAENGKGGVSSHFSLIKGWLNPFPETTGYIIPTLFNYAEFSGNLKYSELAVKLTHWLCSVQLDNGACMQGAYNEKKEKGTPIIFNTGQNILGFVRAYNETKDEKFLYSAKKAGDFLIASTDSIGVWDKNLHRGIKHTINVRCSWALLQLDQVIPNPEYVNVAEANLDWAIQQQTDNGWFHHGTSRYGGLPNTHFLAYTCEGLLESYKINMKQKYIDACIKTAYKMLKIFETRKMLYAFWDDQWKNHGKYFRNSKGEFICLTGNIQIAGVWMQLFQETNDFRYLNSAFKMIDYVKTLQNIDSEKEGICGGIKGSFPVYGSYSTLMYPNWAAKYFADSLMLKCQLKKEVETNFLKALQIKQE